MSYTEWELWTLLDQAEHMPYGPGQIALIEQVIAHADAQHLTPLAFAARMEGTKSYVFGGEPVRSFATFAWCLAEFDRDPQAYAEHQHRLMWHFKYMISAMTKFPEIPLDRAYGVLDDMQRRWQENGNSMHAVYACRHMVASHIGDIDAAERYYVQWCAAPRDELSDCIGCDPGAKAWWLAQRGRYEEVVALAEPVLSGRLSCGEQPQNILTTLMVPYLKTGRLAQARDAHRRAYRLHRPHLADLGNIADHIEFCARTGNEARAVEIVERHLGWLDRAPSPWTAMVFAASSALALRRAEARSGAGSLEVHRPAHRDRPAAQVGAGALAEELAALAIDLAQRFDQRNGTDRVGTMVRATLAGDPWIDHLPLSATAAPLRSAPPPARPAENSTVEEAFAKTPSVAPPPPTPPAAVPDTGHPDELLELIEQYQETGDVQRTRAALDEFEARYGGGELTARQRARFADLQANAVADVDGFETAAGMWREAAQAYAAAGDAEGEHRARARAAAALCWFGGAEEELATLVAATEWLLTHGSPGPRVADANRLAIVYYNTGRAEEAVTVLDRAAGSLDKARAPTRARYASLRLAALARLERFDEILRSGPTIVAEIEASGHPDDTARAHATLAVALRRAGSLIEAADHFGAAIATVTDEQIRTNMRQARAEILARTDRAAEAVDDLTELVADATARGDADEAADARHSLAIAYLNTDRPLDAAEVAEEELAHRRGAEDPEAVVATRDLLATIYQRLGQPAEAVAQLDAIATDYARAGDRAGVAQVAQRAGEILAGADRDEEAAQRFLTAADICAEIDRLSGPSAALTLAELYNRRRHAISLYWAGQTEPALAALAAADSVAARVGADTDRARWELARLEFDAARILWGTGRHSDAAERAGRSAEASLALDSPGAAAESRLVQAQILLEAEQPEPAEAAIQQALAVLPDGANRKPYDKALAAARRARGED